MQVVRERQAAVNPTAGSKTAAAIALMASPAQPVLKEARSMSGPLRAPELPTPPSAKHAIGAGDRAGAAHCRLLPAHKDIMSQKLGNVNSFGAATFAAD